MSHNAFILLGASWLWLASAFYLGFNRDRYPHVLGLTFAMFGTIGFLASARILNEGNPIQIVFSLLDLAVWLYAIGAPATLLVIVRSYPHDEPDEGNLP